MQSRVSRAVVASLLLANSFTLAGCEGSSITSLLGGLLGGASSSGSSTSDRPASTEGRQADRSEAPPSRAPGDRDGGSPRSTGAAEPGDAGETQERTTVNPGDE